MCAIMNRKKSTKNEEVDAMAHSNTVLSQILRIFPRHEFEALCRKHPSTVQMRTFTNWTQFVVMLTAQWAGLDSLRSIVDTFSTQLKNFYHLGINSFSRSTLSRANSRSSSSQLFESVFFELLSRCQRISPSNKKFKFKFKGLNKVYLLDATLIQLPLSIFSWAKYQKTKGAVKLHMGLSIDGYLPTFVNISIGKEHEINKARIQSFPKGSVLVFDRGYTDYKWFKKLTDQNVFFVTRLKKNAVFELGHKRSGRKSEGIISDQKLKLKDIDETFRLVCFTDKESNEEYSFLTNAHHFPGEIIAKLYKERWQVELFFKWIKQHLKVKSFIGTSISAVRTQLWIALCSYLFLAFLKFMSRSKLSLLDILRKIQLNLFVQRDLADFFRPPNPQKVCKIRQLPIFSLL